jgi:hypothetical protein
VTGSVAGAGDAAGAQLAEGLEAGTHVEAADERLGDALRGAPRLQRARAAQAYDAHVGPRGAVGGDVQGTVDRAADATVKGW